MNLTMNAKGALRCTKYISRICLCAHSSAKLNTWSAALCGAAARVSLHTTKESMMKNSTTTSCGALFMVVFALTAPCEIMRASFAKALESPCPLEPARALSTSVAPSTTQATTVTGTQVATPMSSPSGMRSPDRKRPVRKGNGVPTRALVVVTTASLASLAIGNLDDILGLLTVLVNVFSSLSVAAVLVLRRTIPDAPRPFRVPLYPVTPIIYMALAGWSIAASVMDGGLNAIIASIAAVAILLAIKPLLIVGEKR